MIAHDCASSLGIQERLTVVRKGPQFIDYRAEGGWRLSHLEGRQGQPEEKGKLNLDKVEVGVRPSNFLSLDDTAQRVKLGLEVIERQDLGWRTVGLLVANKLAQMRACCWITGRVVLSAFDEVFGHLGGGLRREMQLY